MRFPLQDKNPQTLVDEWQESQELRGYTELQESQELTKSAEQFTADELPAPKLHLQGERTLRKKREEEQKKIQTLSKYVVATVAVTFSSAVAVGAVKLVDEPPVLPPPPAIIFTATEQAVGFRDFSCAFTVDNPDGLAVEGAVYTAAGTKVASEPLQETSGELSFDYLRPETDYVFRVEDSEGKEYFTSTFTTDPFVTFTPDPTDPMKTQFTLHEDLSAGMDVGIDLFTVDGLSFSGNIVWDIEGVSYVDRNALYVGEYRFVTIEYPTDLEGELYYEKSFTVEEGLERLSYDALITLPGYTDGGIELYYLAGDFGEYTNLELEIVQNEQYYFVATEEVSVDGNNIYAMIPDGLEEGNCQIIVWGSVQIGENLCYNQLFATEVVVGVSEPYESA